jgi:hypothetical protein
MTTMDTTAAEYRDLSVSLLFESTTNPRRHFDEAFLKELAESIGAHGILSPLLVRPKGERFEIVFGAQRYRAAQIAQSATVPARIREMTDAQVLEAQLIELSIVGKCFLCLHAARTLFICKRRAGPRIVAPHQIPFGNAISADSAQTVVPSCMDRAMLPKAPFSAN